MYRGDSAALRLFSNRSGLALVSQVRGSNSICTAIDLQLAVGDTDGFQQPLIARKLTKLTPEEIAAIPKKYRPN